MKGLAIARTSFLSYQWQHITPLPYLHRRLNHTRIRHRICFRTCTRTTIYLLRLRCLGPPQFSTQTAHYTLPTYIPPRLLQSPYYPNPFLPLYKHSLLFRPIEPMMDSSGSRRPLQHMSPVHTRINLRHCGLRVRMLVPHRHRSCQLVCLFQVHPTTSTNIFHTSSSSTIPHNLKRQRAMARGRRGYRTTYVLPHVRGRLLRGKFSHRHRLLWT